MDHQENLKGAACTEANCAEFVPGEGYFCKRFGTWAGICPAQKEENMEHKLVEIPLAYMYKQAQSGSVKMEEAAMSDMIEILSVPGTEQGGMLGIDRQGILCFYYDKRAVTDESSYCPSGDMLKKQLEIWRGEGKSFAGMVHSHTAMPLLSRGDLQYVLGMFLVNHRMRAMLMGLVVNRQLALYQFDRADFVPWMERKLQRKEPLYGTEP